MEDFILVLSSQHSAFNKLGFQTEVIELSRNIFSRYYNYDNNMSLQCIKVLIALKPINRRTSFFNF